MPTVVFSIPALREQDLESMPRLKALFANGSQAKIEHSFPAVTWPSQSTVLTGKPPSQHGVVANGFYWRDEDKVEMWTAWNEVIEAPQIWDILKKQNQQLKSAAWFPMLAKGCNADFVCMPAPIHKPDGKEELWCHTKPQEHYGELLEQFGHFPLQHFWGPLANIQSSKWILDSALATARKYSPDFWYIYLPHLDYAAQKTGPNSEAALKALVELDGEIGRFVDEFESLADNNQWLAISEYVISEVSHVTFPNRILRDSGLLKTKIVDGKEHLDYANSQAWALVDHQFGHVFVKNHDERVIKKVVRKFEDETGFQMVVSGNQLEYFEMQHERSGDVVLISTPESWQAYYWWTDDELAPEFARTVDIHRKPGYDPVELHVDMATKSIPLDASLVKGSHGAPAVQDSMQGVILCSDPNQLKAPKIHDTKILDVMLSLCGVSNPGN